MISEEEVLSIEKGIYEKLKSLFNELSKPKIYVKTGDHSWDIRTSRGTPDEYSCSICNELRLKPTSCYWCLDGEPTELIKKKILHERTENRKNTFNILTQNPDLITAEKKQQGTVIVRITNMDVWYTISKETREKLENLHVENKRELLKRSTLRGGHRLLTSISCIVTYISGGYFEGPMSFNPDPEWISTWDRDKIFVKREDIPDWLINLHEKQIIEIT